MDKEERIPVDYDKLVKIVDLPLWAQKSFAGLEYLNTLQSRVFEAAFNKDENMLICAPTGAGKTNVAMLTCL
jgi:replicative superfamily II helicase